MENWKNIYDCYVNETDPARRSVMRRNMRVSVAKLSLPIIVEELNKYSGKNFGEKRGAAFRNACLEKTAVLVNMLYGCHCDSISLSLDVSMGYDDRTATVYLKHGKKLLGIGGKLNSFSVEDFEDYCKNESYVDDIDDFIAKKREELNDVKEAYSRFRELTLKYNRDAVNPVSTYAFKESVDAFQD